MEGFRLPGFNTISSTVRKKRSTTSRKPRPDSPTPLSDNVNKVSSDENTGYDIGARRKEFNLNQFASNVTSVDKSEGETSYIKNRKDGAIGEVNGFYNNGGSRSSDKVGRSGTDFKRCSEGVLAPANWKSTSNAKEIVEGQKLQPENHTSSGRNFESRTSDHGASLDVSGNENKLRKVRLRVGGVTRTLHAKSSSDVKSGGASSDIKSGGASSDIKSGGGSSVKSSRPPDAPRHRPRLILQDNSDDDISPPPPEKASGLQGIPWKDFSRGGFGLAKEDSSKNKMSDNGERVRKSKRVPKRRELDGDFDDGDEDEEIRYLQRLKTSKISVNNGGGYEDGEEGSRKHRKISRVSKISTANGVDKDDVDYGSSRSVRDAKKKPRSERASDDKEYVEEEPGSDEEPESQRQKPMKDIVDPSIEGKREMTLTTRQRALQSGKDHSASGTSLIEFPNGLPPAPPRKQKEKLSEVDQQLKKAEAAQRRKLQMEKAAQESQAEAIRKILGQDSSRKKREDKMKKRREEIAQEKAANALAPGSNIIRWISSPSGNTVIFPKEVGLPSIFDKKTVSYPPPREKCAGPSCNNPYRYRDSKTKLPLCSLECYKAVQEQQPPVSSG